MNVKLSRRDISHERIIDVAARALRRNGLNGVGVADVMKQAGLTHGGFYAHFPSRDALLAAAIERAGHNSVQAIGERMAHLRTEGHSAFRVLVETYLSDNHLLNVENGCVVAALSSEMPRQSDLLKDSSADRVRGLIKLVQQTLPKNCEAGQAMVITSTLVGSLQLARAIGQDEQGKAILAAARHALLTQYDSV
jgi:TetR/AcrR family transcriptional regulator, transcriptional repressor for nem operon